MLYGPALLLGLYGERLLAFYPDVGWIMVTCLWGTVSFLHHLPGPHLPFDAQADGPLLMLRPAGYAMATMEFLPLQQLDFSHLPRDERFSFIVSIFLWCIWKARCSHILSQLSATSADTLGSIWQELIHTLNARWDASTGSTRAAEERREHFVRFWGQTSIFYSMLGSQPQWRYSPPQWFITHTTHRPP